MASSWLFLLLAFKCLHHVTWPLLALVYPMCASIQVIETDSYSETKHLISYWIILSLIYLFEYAFMTLLLRFHLWLYIKLMIIIWLTIPDFGRASYVYNNLIRSMKLQIVTCRLKNYLRNLFFKKDNFLIHAERYMKENGTEALEKLIASKNTMCRTDAEATNEIIDNDSKEMAKTNGERLQTEHKYIKNLEAIVKKEIPATKQDIPVMSNIAPSQNVSSAKVEIKGAAEIDTCGVEFSQNSTQKELQKEWICALCLVTTTSEKTLNHHLSGRKHKATIEALTAKMQSTMQKQKNAKATNEIIAIDNKEILKNTMCKPDADVRNEITVTDNKEMLKKNVERLQIEYKDINNLEAIDRKEIPATKHDISVMPKIGPSQNASSSTVETKGTAESERSGGEVPQSSTSTRNEVQKEWTCALCSVTTTSEKILNSHFSGRKHTAALQKQKDAEVTNKIIATDHKEILKTNRERLHTEHKDIKDSEAIEKNDIPSTKEDILLIPKIGPSQNASSVTVETKGKTKSDTIGGELPQSSTSTHKEVQKEWACALCLVTVPCEKTLNSHLNGKKHMAALKAKKQLAPQKLKIYLSKDEVKQKNFTNMLNSNIKNGDSIANKGLKGTLVTDHKAQKPQNFNFHIAQPTPSPQAIRGPTPFRTPTSSPIRVPFSYHNGVTPFRGPAPPAINVPFPYHGPPGSWACQPEFTYFVPTPSLPPQNPNRR